MRRTSVVLMGLLAACGARMTMSGPAMTARREANFVQAASRGLSCPAAGLQMGYVQSFQNNAHLYRAQGCGGTYESILFCVGVCTWNEVPRQMAAAEMQCPAEQLAWNYQGGGALTFVGCGHMGNYHYVGGQVVSDGVR